MKANIFKQAHVIGCILIIFPYLSLADQSIFVKDDFGKGVKSNVFVSAGGEDEAQGITNDAGVLSIETPCPQGKQVKALPVTPLYYQESIDCFPNQAQLIVKVTKKSFAENLIFNAKFLEAAGQAGDAALAYSEVATRIRAIDTKEASIARAKAYTSFATAIDTPSSVQVVNFDKEQGTTVLTPEFVKILEIYQKDKGLPVTGNIDYKTMSTQADISITNVLSKRLSE